MSTLEFLLPIEQHQIIDRAASRIAKDKRQAFRKHIEDQLRARRDPPSDADVRHAAGAAFLKYGRRI